MLCCWWESGVERKERETIPEQQTYEQPAAAPDVLFHRNMDQDHSQEPVLLQLLHHSLSEWPALQLAIDQGMGGTNAREKQVWMGQVVYDFLLENKHVVDPDELYDYIADMMDNEFDTIVDDGSMSFLTRRISYFCKLVLENNEGELRTILDKKRTSSSSKSNSEVKPQPRNVNETPPQSTSNATSTDPVDQMVVDEKVDNDPDDGWTVVGKKHSKK